MKINYLDLKDNNIYDFSEHIEKMVVGYGNLKKVKAIIVLWEDS